MMVAALCGLFFASGCSALILETLWFRQAGLAFGNSVWASTLVLAGFMSGLALGNALAARFGDRTAHPVRIYAMAETAVAVSGVALVYLFPDLGAWLAPWLRPLLDQPWAINPVRALIAFGCLLVPSAAMGLTLPLITRALTQHDRSYGSALGQLYGWNTAGAVAGVLAAEFLLLDLVGVRGTAIAAGGLNLLAAGIAAVLPETSWRTRTVGIAAAGPSIAAPIVSRSSLPWLSAAFLSGFALLALEVIWFRMLLLAVMSYASTFALMLAIVLAGIALGGLVAGRWLRRSPEAWRWSGVLALATGAIAVATYASLLAQMAHVDDYLVVDTTELIRLAAPLMLPVAVASGIFFTLAGAGLRREMAADGAATGTLTLANTLGAALGSLVAGFVLLPTLGAEGSLFGIVLVYGAIGGLLWRRTTRHGRASLGASLATLGMFGATVALFPFGAMRARLQEFVVTRFVNMRPDSSGLTARVETVREGTAETIIYLDVPLAGRSLSHTMFVNALSMADTDWQSRRYMKLYVYWPMALHPRLERSLLIAYGVGNTAKAMTDSSSLKTIDIVDISKDVLDLSSVVYPRTADNPLHDPRVRVHVEDGRYFLQTTAQRFDLITAEPPPPRSAGVANLYTIEYFQLLRARLSEGGMVAYWLPVHTMSAGASKSVLRAFCDVFEDCSLWHGWGPELMMVGTYRATGPVTVDEFVRQWRDPRVLPEMRRLGLERPEQLGALFIADADHLRAWLASSLPVTDDRPKRIDTEIESTSVTDPLVRAWNGEAGARERFRTSRLIARLWPPALREASLPFFEFQEMIDAHGSARESMMADVHRLLTASPLQTPVLWLLGSDSDVQRIVESATPEELTRPAFQLHVGIRLISERSYAAAAAALDQAMRAPEVRASAVELRAYALAMSGQIEEARKLAVAELAAAPERGMTDAPGASFWKWMDETFGLFKQSRGRISASGVDTTPVPETCAVE